MAWQVVVTDLAGTNVGEVTDAKDRSFAFPLNRLPTVQFKVRLDHALSATLLTCAALVKVYQDKTLMFCGPVTAVEESASGEGGTLVVTASGAFWRLTKRMIGKDSTGYSHGTAVSPVDRGVIASNILTTVNAEGDTGIRVGTVTDSATGYVGPWRFKRASEAISELSATLDGYDFEVAPAEPVADGSGVKIGTFNASAFIGTPRDEVIFEYGTGKRNVVSYSRPVTVDLIGNLLWNLPEGFPDSSVALLVTASDATSIASWGRMEDLVPGDVTVDTMRQKLVDEHLRIRKQPRQTITFVPAQHAPRFGVDYIVGDIVTARAQIAGVIRFDVTVRVYGATVSLDANGKQSTTLDLVPTA